MKRRKDMINVPTRGAKTLLHLSAHCDDVQRLQELIDLGADVTLVDQFGNTALHRACSSEVDALEKVKLLIRYYITL